MANISAPPLKWPLEKPPDATSISTWFLDQSCGHCVNRNSTKGVQRHTHTHTQKLCSLFPSRTQSRKKKNTAQKTGKAGKQENGRGSRKAGKWKLFTNVHSSRKLKEFRAFSAGSQQKFVVSPSTSFFFWGRKRGNFYVRPAGGCSTLSCGQPSSAKLANPAQQLSSNFQL